MKPLNSAERNNAFLNFLLLFLITIGVVVLPIFVSMKVPWSENEQLRGNVSMMQREKNLSDSFRAEMNVVLNNMAMYDTKKDNLPGLRRDVQLKIDKMSELVRTLRSENSSQEKSLYDLVIQNVEDLNNAKYKIRDREIRD